LRIPYTQRGVSNADNGSHIFAPSYLEKNYKSIALQWEFRVRSLRWQVRVHSTLLTLLALQDAMKDRAVESSQRSSPWTYMVSRW
jgi:hypothetical protein